MNAEQNPKMEGCNIIDCIPQSGECPLKCAECFYNGGRFYRDISKPLIPTMEEAKNKIVRVNSGHDSNLQFDDVINATRDYPNKFYNTSLPLLRFRAPTVLTINGRGTDLTFYSPLEVEGDLNDVMLVRFRVNTWNLPLCIEAIKKWRGVPFCLTDMRYYSKEAVKDPQFYEYGKHIMNEYWKLNKEGIKKIFALLRFENVFWCGNPFSLSTLCKDCRMCEHYYVKAKERMKLA